MLITTKSYVTVGAVCFMLSTTAFVACGPGPTSEEEHKSGQVSVSDLRKEGEIVTTQAQAVLLANVGKAIAKGGPQYAVQYCNLEASGIMDSMSASHEVTIGRVSNRNRNPNNAIKGQTDAVAWNYWIGKQTGQGAADTVLTDRAGKHFYYKPIRIGMETCLKCHGSRSTEISLETLNVLDSLYQGDKAVNYLMGDLRGLWKVGF